MSVIRLRLKRGDDEIEVEGPKAEVDELMRTWWSEGKAPATPSKGQRKPRAPSRPRKAATASTAKGTGPAFDPLSIANSVKEDTEFSTLEKRVLHKSDMYNKIALVLTRSAESLTSGQITAILTALDLNADVGNVSNCIKRNSGKFLPTTVRRAGGLIPQYKLTSQARAAFDKLVKHVEG